MKPLILVLSVTFGITAVQLAELPSVCDRQYAIETQSVLKQAAGFKTRQTLKDAHDYMILLKQFEDLTFKIHGFESNITAIGTGTLAKLRMPVTKYNDCRDQRVIHPRVITAAICDATYAQYMLAAIKELALSHDKNTLESYTQHMIKLKNLEDTRFKIHAYESGTKLNKFSTLRTPITNYLGCRDLIIRTNAR